MGRDAYRAAAAKAWVLFKEPLGWRMAAGYVLMLAGLAVIQSQNA